MPFPRAPGPPPNDLEIAEGTKYILANLFHPKSLAINRGEIHRVRDGQEDSELCWCWRVQRWPQSEANRAALPWRPLFVVQTPEGEELLRIHRLSWFPPTFGIFQNSKLIGRIRLRSALRNRYRIEFQDGPEWMFFMPLFNICLYCKSDAGGRV